jgi:glycosyltransferase involved in cell wall biosynthesis
VNVLQVYKTRFPHCVGGVDVVIADLLRHAPAGRHALLRTAEWTLAGVRREDAEGVAVHALHLPLPPARRSDLRSWLFFLAMAPAALARLVRLLRAEAIDLVHLHTLQYYQLYFVIARALGGPPFIITLHRAEVLAYPARRPAGRWAWRQALRRAAAVTAVSPWLAALARTTFPFLAEVVPVPNGIDLPPTLPPGAEVRTRLGLPPDYLLMVGTCQTYKGHEVALRVWAAVAPRLPQLALVLAGDGPLLAEYRARIDALGLTGRVHLTGQLPREEVLALIRDSHAFLMPSRSEGIGLALLEAGALGAPVICSDIGPFREVVEAGVSGLVFPVDDEAALAHAIERLADDAALRRRLAANLAARVRSHHSAAGMCRTYAEIYARVQAGRRGPARPPRPVSSRRTGG